MCVSVFSPLRLSQHCIESNVFCVSARLVVVELFSFFVIHSIECPRRVAVAVIVATAAAAISIFDAVAE